jgi:hypothetical protein
MCSTDPGGFGVNQHQSTEPGSYAEVGLEDYAAMQP